MPVNPTNTRQRHTSQGEMKNDVVSPTLKGHEEGFTSSTSIARLKMLGILYVAYGLYYLPRKADSITKSALRTDMGFSVEDLALSDTVFLSVYTGALLLNGIIGSYIPSNVMLTIGLWSIASVSVLKGYATSAWSYALLQSLHAFAQGTGWPTCIKLLAKWIDGNRGFKMGVWTTCQSLGGIIGALVATYAVSHFTWRYAYFMHVPLLIGWGAVCLVLVRDEPPVSKAAALSNLEKSNRSEANTPVSKPTLKDAIRLPGVLLVAFSYFFLKFLRYALLLWLPFYYRQALSFEVSTAGYLSTSFEMGGLVGTPFIGWLSDRLFMGKRDLTSAVFMFFASILLFLCNVLSGSGVTVNAVLMFLVGILVIGPDSVLSGTIAQDIGNKSVMGSAVVGTLAGFINSVGSCGSIFQSYATAYISATYGWSTLFSLFVVCSLLSSMVLFRVSFQNDELLRGNALKWFQKNKQQVGVGVLCVFFFPVLIWQNMRS